MGILTTSASFLDSTVVDFVVDGIKSVLGILTEGPVGVFLTISLVGTITGLTLGIISRVRN